MKSAPCTPFAPAEEEAVMNAFPMWLDESEEAVARHFFEPYVFFWDEEKSVRQCVCTGCMSGFYAEKEMEPAFFKVHHREKCVCPRCGQRATLLAAGKFRQYKSLNAHERGIQISTFRNMLLVQAGWITRTFDDDDLSGTIDFIPFRRYCFAPGVRFMWRERGGEWLRAETVFEPFQSQPYEQEPTYIPLGIEHLTESSVRYCQYGPWFAEEYGGYLGGLDFDEDPFRIAYFIRYMAEYTRRPQMEFLAKMGQHQLVSDLVIAGAENRAQVDWNADRPAAFFRLSKADYRYFCKAGLQLAGLKDYRKLKKAGLVDSLEMFAEEKEYCGTDFSIICQCAMLAGVTLQRAKNYLWGFEKSRDIRFRDAPQFWLDYLEAAKELKYDLKRDDVRMPKDLRERHDSATAAARIEHDEKQRRKYDARFQHLVRQFEFTQDKLCIRVPRSVQEIVDEGKTLRHCVGGYADRHMEGKVTILFLRKVHNPKAPYVTIEISTENNCAKLHIVQIHGFRNERGGRKSPGAVHKAFLEQWMDWVHEGSKRDEDGKPVLPNYEEKQEVKSA